MKPRDLPLIVILLNLAALAQPASVAGQDQVNMEESLKNALVFGTDDSDDLVVQNFHTYTESLQKGTEIKIPIVGDPTCVKFVNLCPKVGHTVGGDSFSLPTGSGSAYEVELGRADSAGKGIPALNLNIRGSDGTLRIHNRAADWVVRLKPAKSQRRQWEVALKEQDKTPVTGESGGCWVEVPCPKKD